MRTERLVRIVSELDYLRQQGVWVPDAARDLAVQMDLHGLTMLSDRAIALVLIVEASKQQMPTDCAGLQQQGS